MKHQHIYDLCKQHMHSYVLAETEDGNKFDGIVTGLDDEFVYFAIPTGADNAHLDQSTYPHGMQNEHDSYHQYQGMYGNMQNDYHHTGNNPNYFQRPDEQIERSQEEARQPFGYGYPFGWGPGFGFGYRPRRFRRLVLPLAALVALTALPWY